MNQPSDTHRYYLRDLGQLIKQYAREAKVRQLAARGTEREQFEDGELMGFYRIVTLMQQQAQGFGIPLSELQLDDINPDQELI